MAESGILSPVRLPFRHTGAASYVSQGISECKCSINFIADLDGKILCLFFVLNGNAVMTARGGGAEKLIFQKI